jgi:protoporphyrinogen oxidase
MVPGLKPKGAGRFFYPRGGFGQISEAYHRAALAAGADVRLSTPVSGIEIEAGRVTGVTAGAPGAEVRHPAHLVLSTVPLPLLARLARPAAPPEALAAAAALKYRAMILVYLVLEADRFTEYDAHYFPEAEVAITRLSEPKNYGLAPRPGQTVLCAELPCGTADPVWAADDEELGALVREGLAKAGLPVRVPVRRVVTRRLSHAYPVYARGYRQHFAPLDEWAGQIEGLLTLGRQGLFAHDNTHHTLAMAYAAGECVGDDGRLDRARWAEHRRQFEAHVVED